MEETSKNPAPAPRDPSRTTETHAGETLIEGATPSQTHVKSYPRIYPVVSVLRGPQADARFLLDRPEVWIGRDARCEIQLTDEQVSRRHAQLICDSDTGSVPDFRIKDNNSTNGVYVNEKRVAEARLTDRDRITIGRTVLSFSIKDTLELDADSRLFQRATTDPLTGLKNRRAMETLLAQEFSRAKRYGHQLSVAMLDIDHFKNVNDTYGHQIGDEVIKLIARLTLSQVREQDTVCRYGGEEICIILPETDKPGACIVAERIRQAIEKTPLIAGEKRVSFTASLGLTTYEEKIETSDILLARADACLYRAKQSCRNRVVWD